MPSIDITKIKVGSSGAVDVSDPRLKGLLHHAGSQKSSSTNNGCTNVNCDGSGGFNEGACQNYGNCTGTENGACLNECCGCKKQK